MVRGPTGAKGTGVQKLNVFFDVDNTLLMWDGSLRNHTREVFERILADGHIIYIWSGVGIRRWEMEMNKLDHFVTDYFIKPLYDHRARLPKLGVTVEPDFVIDDHRSVVEVFGGYYIPDVAPPDDEELLRVAEAIDARSRGEPDPESDRVLPSDGEPPTVGVGGD